MEEQLLQTWQIHCRINLYVLEAIAPEVFSATPPVKGRSVGQMFAHIHNVRLMWLQAGAPELLEGLTKIEKNDPVDRAVLRSALTASGQAIEVLLKQGLAAGKIKGFKPHPPAFLGYLTSHEAYHHGEIGLVLSQMGYPLDRKTAFGMWEWGVR
jgi:uncharacterized damage-inducible protein DinB